MALNISDAGGQAFLDTLFGSRAKTTSFTVQLITDSVALADSNTDTTHTVADGGDYADQTLSNNAVISLVSLIPTATWGNLTWTFTGSLTNNVSITGYQVLAGTTLLWEEFFATPFQPLLNGDEFSIIPRFQLGNGTPT